MPHQPNFAYFAILFVLACINIARSSRRAIVYNILVGPILWTLEEYMVHRFLLHGTFFQSIHYDHHRTPTAPKHMFLPVELSCLLILVNNTITGIAVTILCYLWFEWSHWKAHQNYIESRCLTKYHIVHHCDRQYNYGFTCAAWDLLFGTCNPKIQPCWVMFMPYPILPITNQ